MTAPAPRKRPKAPKKPAARKATTDRARWALRVLVAALSLAAGLTAGLGYYLLTPHRGSGQTVQVRLPDEPSEADVTRALWQGGVIDHPWVFHGLMVVTRARAMVHTRTLRFRDDLAPRVVLRALLSGSAGLVRVTIPEGYNRFDIARRLEAAGVCTRDDFLRATGSPEIAAQMGFEGAPSLEGFLYPDTYDLGIEIPAARVVERMTRVFRRRYDAIAARAGDGGAELPPGEGTLATMLARVTLASLVEKETGAPEDRAHIASVFRNRLTSPDFHPRLMQSDPTVTYGCLVHPTAACGAQDGGAHGITAAMLADSENPYNTYRVEALPPGPICNPGAAALEAALRPTADRDLYFVAKPDGRSAFAETLAQHTENVRRYLHPQ